ncbi:hypothetical protein CALCODRAFT_486376 [Calocera cornea HHB12733]|uniref:Uncharacterized protein n=1 Tax=Calocera cornea HHB12733 TaxID=1353952 RepID=A0A165DRY8_9BASI|nr:hypothetical protein CALCODRAFT_486376 [Calocera cornea HHB12733]
MVENVIIEDVTAAERVRELAHEVRTLTIDMQDSARSNAFVEAVEVLERAGTFKELFCTLRTATVSNLEVRFSSLEEPNDWEIGMITLRDLLRDSSRHLRILRLYGDIPWTTEIARRIQTTIMQLPRLAVVGLKDVMLNAKIVQHLSVLLDLKEIDITEVVNMDGVLDVVGVAVAQYNFLALRIVKITCEISRALKAVNSSWTEVVSSTASEEEYSTGLMHSR